MITHWSGVQASVCLFLRKTETVETTTAQTQFQILIFIQSVWIYLVSQLLQYFLSIVLSCSMTESLPYKQLERYLFSIHYVYCLHDILSICSAVCRVRKLVQNISTLVQKCIVWLENVKYSTVLYLSHQHYSNSSSAKKRVVNLFIQTSLYSRMLDQQCHILSLS